MSINDENVSGTETRIIGFGNIFMSDDAIGIKIIEEIKDDPAFKDIDIIDGGTSGIDLIFYLKESKRVIIVDAVDAGQDIAEIIKITPEDIQDKSLGVLNSYSLHNLGLGDVIGIAKKLGIEDRLVILGIKPKSMEYGEKLTPEIEKKIPYIIEELKKLI